MKKVLQNQKRLIKWTSRGEVLNKKRKYEALFIYFSYFY